MARNAVVTWFMQYGRQVYRRDCLRSCTMNVRVSVHQHVHARMRTNTYTQECVHCTYETCCVCASTTKEKALHNARIPLTHFHRRYMNSPPSCAASHFASLGLICYELTMRAKTHPNMHYLKYCSARPIISIAVQLRIQHRQGGRTTSSCNRLRFFCSQQCRHATHAMTISAAYTTQLVVPGSSPVQPGQRQCALVKFSSNCLSRVHVPPTGGKFTNKASIHARHTIWGLKNVACFFYGGVYALFRCKKLYQSRSCVCMQTHTCATKHMKSFCLPERIQCHVVCDFLSCVCDQSDTWCWSCMDVVAHWVVELPELYTTA